jgi:hypothetical protein
MKTITITIDEDILRRIDEVVTRVVREPSQS